MTEQLRALVPSWVEWLGPPVFVAGLAIMVWLLPMVPVQVAVRRIHPADHWTRQARYVHAARSALFVAALVVPAAAFALSTFTVGPPARVPGWLLGGAGAVVATLLIGRRSWTFEQATGQPVPAWSRYLKAYLVRVGPWTALFLLAVTAPDHLADPRTLIWLLLAFGIGFWLRYHLEVLCRLGLGKPAGDPISAMVEQTAARVGMDAPEVFIIDYHQPNAFAFPWRGKIAFTRRAVDVLSLEELESIALHELGHLAESQPASAVRQAMHFVWVPVVLAKPIVFTYGVPGILALLALYAGMLVPVRVFARTMESRSDVQAAHFDDSATYGRALEKVYRIGLIPAVLRRPSHGQFRDRLEKAGLVPDFDPPAAPPFGVSLASVVLVLLLGSALLLAPFLTALGAQNGSPIPAYVALGFGTYGPWPYERLGELAEFDGDYSTAEAFYAAGVDESTDLDLMLALVYVRAQLGRCSEANAVIDGLPGAGATPEDMEVAGFFLDWCDSRPASGAQPDAGSHASRASLAAASATTRAAPGSAHHHPARA